VSPGQSPPIAIRFPTYEELAERICKDPVDFEKSAIIRFLIADATTGKPLANTPAILSRVPIGEGGKVVADSAASYDVTLDARGGFLACGLRGDEIVRIEAVPEAATPWMETIRPRAGTIGWHVVRVGKR
jgi:hypothetical protein